MDDISIKTLDALFDLCDGENYVILDEEDITSRLPHYTFEPNELTEILEALTVDNYLDLKYSDDKEYCVAMRTRGRSLVKQVRERLQNSVNVAPEPSDRPKQMSFFNVEEESFQVPQSDRRSSVRAGRVSAEDPSRYDADRSDPSESRQASEPLRQEEEKKPPVDWKAVLPAFLGAAAGALLINLIFLMIFLMKFGG